MILSITEAAKKARVSRSHLYSLKNKGKISFITDEHGKNMIELSELARVFPKVMSLVSSSKTSLKTSQKTPDDKPKDKMSIELLSLKLASLQEKTNFLEQQLSLEQDRNSRLIETLQHQTKYLLPVEVKTPKSFWKRWLS
jgi:hypothetical protein